MSDSILLSLSSELANYVWLIQEVTNIAGFMRNCEYLIKEIVYEI